MYHFTIDKDGIKRNDNFRHLEDDESKVCVVSLIGKSRLDRYRMKSGVINSFIRADIFAVDSSSSKSNCFIEGYYHKSENVLFLHLISRSDALFRMELYRRWPQEDGDKDHGDYIREANHDYLRALMFVFSVSHIILVNEPGSSFDISYIRLFKNLEHLRMKLQSAMAKLFTTNCPDLPRGWMEHGRPCPPRVLFLFETCLLSTDLSCDDAENHEMELFRSKSKKISALKELQRAIEEMIYKAFRRDRIITNISNNSLLALPNSQEFVYILSEDELSSTLFNPAQQYASLLSETCQWPENNEEVHPDITGGQRPPFGRRGNRAPSPTSSNQHSTSKNPVNDSDLPSLLASRIRLEDEDLRNFLKSHIDLALKKGFDDNVGRVNVEPLFELSSAKLFLKVTQALHSLFWANVVNEDDAKIFKNFFEDFVDLDLKFSETHCSKLFPLAINYYKDDLPEYYNKKHHLDKVNQTKQYFMVNARGPSVAKYLKKLEADCKKVWKDGRRGCEKISMKGHPCRYQLHKSFDATEREELAGLPTMSHSSGVSSRATCNCGRLQGDRLDPFDHKEANHDFFKELESRCCGRLEHFNFSLYTPTSPDSSFDDFKSSIATPTKKKKCLIEKTKSLRAKSPSEDFPKLPSSNEAATSDDAKGKENTDGDFEALKFSDSKSSGEQRQSPVAGFDVSPSSTGLVNGEPHDHYDEYHLFDKPTVSKGEERSGYDDDDDVHDIYDGDYKLSQRDADDDDMYDEDEEDDDDDGGGVDKLKSAGFSEENEASVDDEEEDIVDNVEDEVDGERSRENGEGDRLVSSTTTDGDGRVTGTDEKNVESVAEEEDDDDDGDGDDGDGGESEMNRIHNEDPIKEEDNDESSIETATSLSTTTKTDNNNTAATDNNNKTADDTEDSDESEESFDFSSDEESTVDVVLRSRKNFLVGMLNSESAKGLLPLFSSWSLVRVGKYSSYEASKGLDQPGFTHQANFLLPIDIRIRVEDDIPSSSPLKPQKKSGTRSLRLYVGLEYECFKGHRFLMASPNRMLKVPLSNVIKETGHKVVNNDMPLYFPCSCRGNSSQVAQLMRIHVAVPDCDLEVKLKVKVQPNPSPCPVFFPESAEPITLRSGHWVMRLPYVYFDGTKSYQQPSDPKFFSSCKLFKGFLAVLEKPPV